MRRLFVTLVACTAVVILTAANGGEFPNLKREALMGEWRHRDLTFRLGPPDHLTIAQTRGDRHAEKTYTFGLTRMAEEDFLCYTDSTEAAPCIHFMLVDTVTDTSAILAAGTPFIRVDAGSTILGSWRHVEGFTVLNVVLGDRSFAFTRTRFDLGLAVEVVEENRAGLYEMAADRGRGRLKVTFGDGTQTTLAALLYDDALYLFDLNPGKSWFRRIVHNGATADAAGIFAGDATSLSH